MCFGSFLQKLSSLEGDCLILTRISSMCTDLDEDRLYLRHEPLPTTNATDAFETSHGVNGVTDHLNKL